MTKRRPGWGLPRAAVAASLAGAALGGGCGGKAGTTATDTNTNWLHDCDGDADCGSALSCLCGICTVTCGSTKECKAVGGHGVCSTSPACAEALTLCEDEDTGVSGGETEAPTASGGAGQRGSTETTDSAAGAGGRSPTPPAPGAAGLPERPSSASAGAPDSIPPSTAGASSSTVSRMSEEDYTAASAARPSGIGPCTDGWIDFGCDSILEPCPRGMHRDFDASDPCAICVDDPATPLSCEVARARYTALLEHIIPSGCADSCEEDSDCGATTLENACGECQYALFRAVDEQIIEAADQFSAETCTPACGSVLGPTCDASTGEEMEALCVSNRCTLRPVAASGDGPFTVRPGGYVTSGNIGGYAWTSGDNVTPEDFSSLAAGGELCVSGTVPATPDYSGTGMIGIYLNQAPSGLTEADDFTPTGSGIKIAITNVGGSPLRLQVRGTSDYCTDIAAPGGSFAWSELRVDCWEDGGHAYDPSTPITAVMVLLPGEGPGGVDVDYEFCITDLEEVP